MLYIRKGRTPELVKEKSQDIKDTPGNDLSTDCCRFRILTG